MPSHTLSHPQRGLSDVQFHYLTFSAQRKLSGETSRDKMRLRQLVGHANLLDRLMAQSGDDEIEDQRHKSESQKPSQNQIQPSAPPVIRDRVTFDTTITVPLIDEKFGGSLTISQCTDDISV